MRRYMLEILVALALSHSGAMGAVPTQISVQGRATDAAGEPLSPGDKEFVFKIFNAESGGSEIWPGGGEPQTISTDVAGLWSANIGASIPLSEAVFSSDVRWLEITITGTILPRVRLVTGPYANRVATVDGASGGVINSKVSIGPDHTATGLYTFVAGRNNIATGNYDVIAGGFQNNINQEYGSVGGGTINNISGAIGTIAGGSQNAVQATGGSVGGGVNNWTFPTATYAVIPGGKGCQAAGAGSFACGNHAYTGWDGMFVWNDNINDLGFPLPGDPSLFPGPNFFCCRTTGGAFFATGVNASGHITSAAWLPLGSGSWVAFSDKNAKHGFQDVNHADILNRVVKLPITTWSYNAQGDSVRHIGPMAQEFRAAFGVGESEKYISPMDEAGVAYAAIKALAMKLDEKDQQIADLKSQVEELARRIDLK